MSEDTLTLDEREYDGIELEAVDPEQRTIYVNTLLGSFTLIYRYGAVMYLGDWVEYYIYFYPYSPLEGINKEEYADSIIESLDQIVKDAAEEFGWYDLNPILE